jgi:rare lipoprotein A (peptidoglycan hydrolase)
MHPRSPHDFQKSRRLQWALVSGAILSFLLAGCSSQNFSSAPLPSTGYYAPSHESYRGTRTEVASWYGPGFEGHRTSSGEVFHSNELTAASTTLPLGSHAVVTNPDTGRSVLVRINDRGPFVRGRSIDLSHGAAQQIGLTGKGVGRVEVTPTARATPSVASRTAVYRYSSTSYAPGSLHYVSSESRSYAVRRRSVHRYRHYSSRRTVSNPIGAWLASAVPRF